MLALWNSKGGAFDLLFGFANAGLGRDLGFVFTRWETGVVFVGSGAGGAGGLSFASVVVGRWVGRFEGVLAMYLLKPRVVLMHGEERGALDGRLGLAVRSLGAGEQ